MYDVELDTLQEAAYQADLEITAIYRDYSGRGMYGRTCLGLVHHSPGDVLKFALVLNRLTDGEAEEWLCDSRSDSMGLSMITYWPNAQVVEEGVPNG